ncbi:MAG: hypothetical protein ABII27_09045 [bacterium]
MVFFVIPPQLCSFATSSLLAPPLSDEKSQLEISRKMKTTNVETIRFSSYMPESYYQQLIQRLLWENNHENISAIFVKAHFTAEVTDTKVIKVTRLPWKHSAELWHLWKVDFECTDGRILETVCRLSRVKEQEQIDEVYNVRNAHRILDTTGLTQQIFFYKNFNGEPIIFEEYIPYDESIEYKSHEELIAEAVILAWFNSDPVETNRWIPFGVHHWQRGNIRLFKDAEGIVKAKILDVGSHIHLRSLKELIRYLTEGDDSLDSQSVGRTWKRLKTSLTHTTQQTTVFPNRDTLIRSQDLHDKFNSIRILQTAN